VPTGCGDGQGPFGVFLAAHVGEVALVAAALGEGARQVDGHRLDRQFPSEHAHRLGETAHRNDVQPLDHAGFRRVGLRADDPAKTVLPGQQRSRQDTFDRTHPPVESQLARHQPRFGFFRNRRTPRQDQTQRDRQVEDGAFLAQVSRGEVDHALVA
jgi:hypothetical protein